MLEAGFSAVEPRFHPPFLLSFHFLVSVFSIKMLPVWSEVNILNDSKSVALFLS